MGWLLFLAIAFPRDASALARNPRFTAERAFQQDRSNPGSEGRTGRGAGTFPCGVPGRLVETSARIRSGDRRRRRPSPAGVQAAARNPLARTAGVSGGVPEHHSGVILSPVSSRRVDQGLSRCPQRQMNQRCSSRSHGRTLGIVQSAVAAGHALHDTPLAVTRPRRP